MKQITLNIAGEKVVVQFDGTTVFDQSGYIIHNYHAACGMTIPQDMLVETVKRKIEYSGV